MLIFRANQSAAAMTSHTLMAPTQPDQTQSQDADENSSGTALLNLDHYRPFFRELDLDVLKLFSIDKVGYFWNFLKISNDK